jgi:4'-phosphopantetheinyl transferase
MLGEWKAVEALPPLQDDEVQLWQVELTDAASMIPTCATLLTPEEQDRASRRRAGHVRDQFVLARASLRTLLGHALELDPLEVPIYESSHGKPETPAMNGRSVSYNVAHSQGTILIALCRRGTVGVDVEHLDRATDIMEVAQFSFTPNEIAKLAALEDPDQRKLAFYRCWTQKEAIIKADGRGLSLSLSTFDVPIHSARSAPIRIAETPDDAEKLYFVSEILLGDQAVGAIALESIRYRINMLTFPTALCFKHRDITTK